MENLRTERIWELISRKLSNEATEVELQELQSLLQQQPEEAYSLEIMEDLWKASTKENKQYAEYQYKQLTQRMGNMGIDINGFEVRDEHLITMQEEETYKESWFSAKRKLMMAAFVILAITVSSLIILKTSVTIKDVSGIATASEISTKYGSKTTIVLPDGTKVWVNAGSKLTYDNSFGNKLREVSLLGEAFFDVTKNAEKPFIIHTAKMDIKVLGTAFNVRCYPNEKKTETSLIRGRIEVTIKNRPSEKIYLSPNEKLTLINDEIVTPEIKEVKKVKHAIEATEPLVAIGHLTYQPIDSSIIETSWVENKLVFRGETFEDVALKMERWYGVTILISNDNLKQAHLTGSFETETVEQALTALQLTTKFKFNINKKNITITQ